MSLISEVLEAYETGLTEEDVARMLRRALESSAHSQASALTADEAAFLAAHAGVEGYDPSQPPDARTLAAARLGAEISVLATSLCTEQLAKRLGVDESRIRHRAREGSLYAVRTGRSLRFPIWQFDDALRPLPGLAAVLAALPKGLHPAEVEGWMTVPNQNLAIGERTVSARDWLLSGGDARRVVELAESLARW